jgi:signal transduction histidine kinase
MGEAMIITDRLISFVICLGLFLSTGLAVYTWGRRYTAGGKAATTMLLALSFWLGTNLVGDFFADPGIQFFFEKLGYLGVVTLPVAWFAFAMVSNGKERMLTRRRIALLLIIPAFTLLLVFSGAYFQKVQFGLVNGVESRRVEFSAWVWLASGYAYMLIASGTVLFIRSMLRSPYLQRLQVAVLIVAALFPIVTNVLYLTRIVTMEFDITPMTFTLSAVVLVIGFFRYNLFDVVPVARHAMVERVSEGMIVVDARGQVADLNPAAGQALHVDLAGALGQPLAAVLPALSANLASQTEIELAQGDEKNYYEVSITPLHLETGLLVGHLYVLHNVTARKQVEVELKSALDQQRELNEMKSRFYLYLSHQLRTPLSVIMSSAEMLDAYGRDWADEKRSRHFKRIYQAIERLTGLSQQAAALEKAEHSLDVFRPENFDPWALFKQVTDELQSTDCSHHLIQADILQAEAGSGSRLAHQDPVLLRQVLENLLGNALKFSPDGSQILFQLEVSDRQLSFTIQDHGCGIPEAELDLVFVPFFRASNVTAIPGTGLGLAIANQYVRQMGGSLTLKSRANQGTTASVCVPMWG